MASKKKNGICSNTEINLLLLKHCYQWLMSKDSNHEGKLFRKKKKKKCLHSAMSLHSAMTEAFSLHCVFLLGFSSMPIE